MSSLETQTNTETATLLTEENYSYNVLCFRDRQAGISLIFDPERGQFVYNAYCLEKKLLKELLTKEFDFLSDALDFVNSEFATWELTSFEKKNCGNCAAK